VLTELAAQTHFFSVEEQSGETAMAARFAVRGLIGMGAWL
jgi:hypothetical protein